MGEHTAIRRAAGGLLLTAVLLLYEALRGLVQEGAHIQRAATSHIIRLPIFRYGLGGCDFWRWFADASR